MSCKTLKLNSCEILGSTFSGRTFNFPDRDISQDKFTAKVKGFAVTNANEVINGVVAGNSVFFSKDSLSNLKSGRYVIEYWADFKDVANEMIALEDFLISTTPCACSDDSLVHDFILEFPTETIEYSVKSETTNIYLDFEDLTPEQILELQKPALEVIEQTEIALAKSILATSNSIEATENAIEATESSVVATNGLETLRENVEIATTNANAKAQLALDASSIANQKAVLAESASVLANQKAELADTATQNANTATANYSQKLTEINNSISGANTAKDSANQAAQTANNAKGWSPLLVMDSTTIAEKSLLKLTDWTGGTGTKPTTNVGKWLKGDGTYTDVPSEANDLKGEKSDNLILEYVHSGNKEALIQSIDYTTNTFTSIGHGFLNNQRVCFAVPLDIVFPSLVLPISNGLPQNGFNLYYIINVTQDTFQLSTSSGGLPFVLNNKPTVDFSKFKIEERLASLNINNLPPNLTDVKVEIFGKSNRGGNIIRVHPSEVGGTNWISGSNTTSITTNGGTVFINGIYEFSIKNNTCQAKQDIYAVTSVDDTANTAVLKQQSYVRNTNGIQFITSIFIETSAIPNGFIIRIYKK